MVQRARLSPRLVVRPMMASTEQDFERHTELQTAFLLVFHCV